MQYSEQIQRFTQLKNLMEAIINNLGNVEHFPGKDSFRKHLVEYVNLHYKILKMYSDLEFIANPLTVTTVLKDIAKLAKEAEMQMRRAEEFTSLKELRKKLSI